MYSRQLLLILITTVASTLAASLCRAEDDDPVRFNRDVRPILAEKCLHCHGPDANQRQADLRLDDPQNVFAKRDDYQIIAPGAPGQSELLLRIESTDDDHRMPPPDQERQLTPPEIETLRRWIAQGAEYETHWSFIAPRRPPAPAVGDESWPHNTIDHFVLALLEQEGLAPSPEAGRTTLIRRATLDLTGLPPTIEEVDAFLADESPGAYERLIDRLLASPRYGERMALPWLDAARYADSGGYQGDILRVMWPWRDWLIAALNDNMPFDQFTIEQLAGDLLPEPTLSQRIATGFNRNHRINDEDGIILEEFRVEYVADRLETTATVWLGLTIGCARCHDHKYDPISQREYYQLFAYFNSVDELGRGHGNSPPLLQLPTDQQQAQLDAIDAELATLRAESPETLPDSPEEPAGPDERIKTLDEERAQLLASITTTMVMLDVDQPRETFILVRGGYDKPGEPVGHGVPAFLSPLPDDAQADRLALARWLVDPRHPLTARVTVNRFWQMHFGRGLVETAEDFGTQGELPTHPRLLDWLASELIRTGWDVKAMQRLIVTSAAYRQSSAGSPELYARDPDNRLLARGPRFRLPAELLRDQALAASGLLAEQLGGPSVKPYQPAGLWNELASASTKYVQDHGADLYRRGLYTFIRRTVPHPAMTTLDAPNREICAARRQRTNTPTQALALMNDPTFVEAARKLAETALLETQGENPRERIRFAFRRLLSRSPSPAELDLLTDLHLFYEERYRANPDAAAQLISIGESPVSAECDPAELAALAAVTGLLLNLDEVLVVE